MPPGYPTLIPHPDASRIPRGLLPAAPVATCSPGGALSSSNSDLCAASSSSPVCSPGGMPASPCCAVAACGWQPHTQQPTSAVCAPDGVALPAPRPQRRGAQPSANAAVLRIAPGSRQLEGSSGYPPPASIGATAQAQKQGGAAPLAGVVAAAAAPAPAPHTVQPSRRPSRAARWRRVALRMRREFGHRGVFVATAKVSLVSWQPAEKHIPVS